MKGNGASTLSPFTFVAGAPVTSDPYREVIEQSAYSAGFTPEHLGGVVVGPDGWDSDGGAAPWAGGQVFDPGGGWETVHETWFRIGADSPNLWFGASCLFAGGESGEVRIVVGGVARVTLAFDDTTNDSFLSDRYAAADIGGAGEYEAQVQIRMTGGVAADNRFCRWWHHGAAVDVASDWPDPSG